MKFILGGVRRESFFILTENLCPDILTMSKSFGGGKSSISCFVTTSKIFEKAYGNLEDSMIHLQPITLLVRCATAIEAINIAVEENYPLKAKNNGKLITKN